MQIDEKIRDLENFARLNSIPIVRSTTGERLQEEIRKCKPNRILEIGTAIGYSGILMLRNCPNSTLVTIEKDEERYKLAKQNFQDVNVNAECILGDAYEVLAELEKRGDKFDFIFLDGPKGFYFRYLQLIKKLISDKSCIFADNVGFFGMVKSNKYPHRHKTIVVSLQNYLKEVTNPPFESQVELDIDDGFAITKYEGDNLC